MFIIRQKSRNSVSCDQVHKYLKYLNFSMMITKIVEVTKIYMNGFHVILRMIAVSILNRIIYSTDILPAVFS